MKEFPLVAKTYFGLEQVLADELLKLGANDIELQRRAVSFTGDKALMYRANLSLRTAIRVLMPIVTFNAKDADEVYAMVKAVEWEKYMTEKNTFQIDATVNSETFRHSQYVTYRVKDAIADRFMERCGKRPSVRLNNPDFYINVHVSHNACTISLDSSGESLHRRGYRSSQNEAPIAEALAAGMLLMAGWDGQCNFVDPMCGSGTFLIEAALIALNIPPCIYRSAFAFEKWNDFDKDLFDDIYNDDSQERPFEFRIQGYDVNPVTVRKAQENIKAAGLGKYITVERRSIVDFVQPEGKWLMVTNPPYGERLVSDDMINLYKDLGFMLKHRFVGNEAWVISSNQDLLSAIGLRPSVKIPLVNGSLECEFRKFELFSGKRNEYLRDSNDFIRANRDLFR